MKVFICGTQRSGTTLLRALIDSNSSVYFPPAEMKFFTHFYKFRRKYEYRDKILIDKFLNDYAEYRNILYSSGLISDKDFVEKIRMHSTWSDIFNDLLYWLAAQENKFNWGEKTPGNEFFTKEILSCFPEAKLIYIIRNPKSVVASSKKRYNKGIIRPCLRWKYSINKINKDTSEFKSNNCIVISYENLVYNTKECLNEIFAFLKLPSIKANVVINGTKWYTSNTSYDSVQTEGVYKDSVFAYKNNITPLECLIIDFLCFPLDFFKLKNETEYIRYIRRKNIHLPYKLVNIFFDKRVRL